MKKIFQLTVFMLMFIVTIVGATAIDNYFLTTSEISTTSMSNISRINSTFNDAQSKGIQVFEIRGQYYAGETETANQTLLQEIISASRRTGIKVAVPLRDITENGRTWLNSTQLTYANSAILIGGQYNSLALDRFIFSFTNTNQSVLIEKPRYHITPGFAYDTQNVTYFPVDQMVKCEYVVLNGGYSNNLRQNLSIIPCQSYTQYNSTMWNVTFDLTMFPAGQNSTIAFAPYWNSTQFLSLYNNGTAQILRDDIDIKVSQWTTANGGTFPSDVVAYFKYGDEDFYTTSTEARTQNGVSMGLFDYSNETIQQFNLLNGVDEYPRATAINPSTNIPYIYWYGSKAHEDWLNIYHIGTANLISVAQDEIANLGLNVSLYRIITRSGMNNPTDPIFNKYGGVGYTKHMNELNITAIDPYPYFNSGYTPTYVMTDGSYLQGITAHNNKSGQIYLQSQYAPYVGLANPTPNIIGLNYIQALLSDIDSVQWFDYDNRGFNGLSQSTFPNQTNSWNEVSKLTRTQNYLQSNYTAKVAVIIPYEVFATDYVGDGYTEDLYFQYFLNFLTVSGLKYDLYEIYNMSELDLAKLQTYTDVFYFTNSDNMGGIGYKYYKFFNTTNSYSDPSFAINSSTYSNANYLMYIPYTYYRDCYQEFTNVSTDCGGKNTGVYFYTAGWSAAPPGSVWDGDWNTFNTATSQGNVTSQYKKPNNYVGITAWQVKDGNGIRNLTMPSVCANALPNDMIVKVIASTTDVNWTCYNGTQYQTVYTASGTADVYEEAIIWNVTGTPIQYNNTGCYSGSNCAYITQNNNELNTSKYFTFRNSKDSNPLLYQNNTMYKQCAYIKTDNNNVNFRMEILNSSGEFVNFVNGKRIQVPLGIWTKDCYTYDSTTFPYSAQNYYVTFGFNSNATVNIYLDDLEMYNSSIISETPRIDILSNLSNELVVFTRNPTHTLTSNTGFSSEVSKHVYIPVTDGTFSYTPSSSVSCNLNSSAQILLNSTATNKAVAWKYNGDIYVTTMPQPTYTSMRIIYEFIINNTQIKSDYVSSTLFQNTQYTYNENRFLYLTYVSNSINKILSNNYTLYAPIYKTNSTDNPVLTYDLSGNVTFVGSYTPYAGVIYGNVGKIVPQNDIITVTNLNLTEDNVLKMTIGSSTHDNPVNITLTNNRPNSNIYVLKNGILYNTFLSDANGDINFLYNDGFSDVTFTVFDLGNTTVHYDNVTYETASSTWTLTLPISSLNNVLSANLIQGSNTYYATRTVNANNITYTATFNVPAYTINKPYTQQYNWRVNYLGGTSSDIDYFNSTIYTQINLYPRNLFTLATIHDVNITLNNTNDNTTYSVTNDGTDSVSVLITAGNYTITATGAMGYDYANYSSTFNITTESTKTYYIDFGFNTDFNLMDEATNKPFNISHATSVNFVVFCPTSTIITPVNSSNFTVPVTCKYSKFIFSLTFGTQNYYRTFLRSPAALNQTNDIYLIDMSTTPSVYITFKTDDALSLYRTPGLYIMKYINNTFVQIHADAQDIEGKVGVYLIQNDVYTVDLYDQFDTNTNPFGTFAKRLGDYVADISGVKTIRLYDFQEGITTTGINNVKKMIFITNNTGSNVANANYYDSDSLTTSLTFLVYLNNITGTLINSQIAPNINNAQFSYDMSTYPNSKIVCALNYTTHGQSFFYVQECQKANTNTLLPIQGNDMFGIPFVSQTFLSWFFFILLTCFALVLTPKYAKIGNLVICGMAALFISLNWFALGYVVIGIAVLFTIISLLREKERVV